jgi:hypothetical protein
MLDETHQRPKLRLNLSGKDIYNDEISGEPFVRPMEHGQVVEQSYGLSYV